MTPTANTSNTARSNRQGSRRPRRTKKQRSRKQVVAGFVIFRKTEEGCKFLLLYRRGSYWNFPKGHFEAGEDSLATALRETEEETGLKKSDLSLIPSFRAYEHFSFERENERIYDTVILYLAETIKADIHIAPREHSGFAWFLYADAIRVLGKRYAGTKRVLKQAHDFIYGKGISGDAAHSTGNGRHIRRRRSRRRKPSSSTGGRERAQQKS